MKKSNALTQADLDKGKCENPECPDDHDVGTPFFFHASCHPESPLVAIYHPLLGCVQLCCATCRKSACTVEVAP